MSTPQSALVWNSGRRGLPLDLGMPSSCVLAGVEHEYAAWDGAVQQDFRTLLPAVAGDLRALDPGDPRARRLPSGCALTADGWEAEIATPPLPVGPGAPQRLDALLATQRTELAVELAAQGVPRLTGFSTHVNISVPDDRVVDIGRQFVRHAALCTVIAAEPRQSAGLLVRPRRSRLEIGGEYAEGEDLVALVTFVSSAVGALVAGSVPPRGPAPVVVPSREKYGWHLPPEGPYAMLLADGPTAALSVGTSVMTAKELFELTWRWARPSCLAQGLDPGACDRLVAGRRWRLQSTLPAETFTVLPVPVHDPPALGYDTTSRKRPGGVVAETTWVSWGHVAWGFHRGPRALYAVIPATQEEEFLRRLDGGHLDEIVDRELSRRGRRRRLMVNAQITGPAWWDEIRPGALVPAERDGSGVVPRVSYRRALRAHRTDSSGSPAVTTG